MQIMTIHIDDRPRPASKNGMGIIRGPTPSSKLTEVNRAEYFGCIFGWADW